MSDATESVFDSDEPQTGSVSADSSSSNEDSTENNKKFAFSVWDAMLLISMLCVITACILLVFELRNFSNFPFSYPWNVSDAKMQ